VNESRNDRTHATSNIKSNATLHGSVVFRQLLNIHQLSPLKTAASARDGTF